MDSRVINYYELAQMSHVFDVNLSGGDKQNLIGRKNNQIFPTIRRKDGCFLSSFDETQTSLDDFLSENDVLGNFHSEKHRKKHHSENDSLLENSDSLVDFFIRKFCIISSSESSYKSF